MAICLQNLLAAAFPNSEEHVPCLDTSPLSLNHEHKCVDYNGTELHQKMLGEGLQKTFFTCNTQQERFNVYGPVRSVCTVCYVTDILAVIFLIYFMYQVI